MSNVAAEGIAVDLLFAAQPFTGLEHHALHILRGLRTVGVSVDVLVPADVMSELGDAARGHRLVPFAKVPRGLRLGREQWSLPWRFGAYPQSLRLLHSVLGVAPLLNAAPLVLTVPLGNSGRPDDSPFSCAFALMPVLTGMVEIAAEICAWALSNPLRAARGRFCV